MKGAIVTRDELRRLIQGPINTLPTPMNADYSLDLGAMAELTKWWVESGITRYRAPLKVAAAMGEGPDLNDEEWPQLLKSVVDAAGSDAAVICALKTKNTLHTIEDAKQAQDLGAIGLQIDLPIFHNPTQDDYVRYFTDISDNIDIGIMIYNTFWHGPQSLTAETINRLRDAGQVIAIKWSVPADIDYDTMTSFADHFNVIDNSSQPVRCHKNGGAGYIDSTTAVHPAHALKVWDLCKAGQYEEAQALFDSVTKPLRALMAKSAKVSGGYRVVKGQMAAIGHPVGPPRLPTLPLTEAEYVELRDLTASFGWPVVS
jgi:4-hydroxy-tetrahydrodipicolinate synthase